MSPRVELDQRPPQHTARTWPEALAELSRRGEGYVLVTLIATQGSTPRASGSKMVVTAEQSYDSIGGGHLEFKAIAHARQLLLEADDSQSLQHFALGASLGQCCGGQASVLFEHFAPPGLPVQIYGAGHVARALMPILAQLPLRLQWIDSRAEQFPDPIPQGVQMLLSDDPVEHIAEAPSGSAILVLTHNHQLDYELTEAALRRADLGFLGVIGSATKARRFRQRLHHRGFDAAQIERFTCPIGLDAVPGKRPMEVAVSISAQLIALYQARVENGAVQSRLDWRELHSLLAPDPTTSASRSESAPADPLTDKDTP